MTGNIHFWHATASRNASKATAWNQYVAIVNSGRQERWVIFPRLMHINKILNAASYTMVVPDIADLVCQSTALHLGRKMILNAVIECSFLILAVCLFSHRRDSTCSFKEMRRLRLRKVIIVINASTTNFPFLPLFFDTRCSTHAKYCRTMFYTS